MDKVQEAYLKNEAIRNNFVILIRGMEIDQESIATQCYAKGLIPKVMLNAKPKEMLIAIQSFVASDGSGCGFQAFCDILADETSTAHLAHSLQKTLLLLRKRKNKKIYSKFTIPLYCYNLPESQCDPTPDTGDDTGDETGDDTGDETGGETGDDKPNMGNIGSVTDPNFDSNNQKNKRGETISIPSSKKPTPIFVKHPKNSSIFADNSGNNSDHKCCRHRMEINRLMQEKNNMEQEFRQVLLSERHKHRHMMKLVKLERREHIRKLKNEIRHLRVWLKDSRDRENQLNTEVQYQDLYYKEIKGENSQLLRKLQVEQEKLAKCLEKKARLREQVTDLKSLLTVSQDDCHRHYLAERQLQDRVDELENKVTQLETKNKPVLEAQTSNDSDLLFHSICKSFSQFSCYSSGSSSNSSHSASPPDTPIATVPSTPPSPSSSPHFSNHSPSHAPHNFSSYSPRNTPDSSPNESSSNSTHHFLSHSPKPLT